MLPLTTTTTMVPLTTTTTMVPLTKMVPLTIATTMVPLTTTTTMVPLTTTTTMVPLTTTTTMVPLTTTTTTVPLTSATTMVPLETKGYSTCACTSKVIIMSVIRNIVGTLTASSSMLLPETSATTGTFTNIIFKLLIEFIVCCVAYFQNYKYQQQPMVINFRHLCTI